MPQKCVPSELKGFLDMSCKDKSSLEWFILKQAEMREYSSLLPNPIQKVLPPHVDQIKRPSYKKKREGKKRMAHEVRNVMVCPNHMNDKGNEPKFPWYKPGLTWVSDRVREQDLGAAEVHSTSTYKKREGDRMNEHSRLKAAGKGFHLISYSNLIS